MSQVENPYQTFGMAAHADVDVRASFIRKTYLHLAGAILAFVGIEALIFNVVPEQTLLNMVGTMVSGLNWLIVIIVFMVVSTIANKWAHSAVSLQTQYMGLGLYVLAMSIIFIPLLFVASRYAGPDVIPTAAVITLLMFAGLTAIVLLTGADFSFLRTALMLGMFAAMIFIFGSIFFDLSSVMLFFVIAMIVLMCGYILYYTSNVLHHYRTTQYVAASLALFASVAMLFYYVLYLVMMLSGRD